eukprot:CAMPEP_0119291500 /NCGR_PEP_ID=MMETSP1329-20130426/42559_1 /TAXON_ID=114041 /ORGANISM="Genus nov. species nov., Strain RCC1024" /LENGTH=348 /DNA_ID=CAMNT_0007292329 /DNA_START=147 /DNA_END=1190 /DNA_ORIENTATION=+
MLWVDKHRPLTLDKMHFHSHLSERFLEMTEEGESDLPHLLFYGPSGAGKKTRIMALLRALYGPGAEKQRLEHREFKTPTNKSIEVTTVASNYHIEINPSDAGNDDRFVVQEVVKEIASTRSVLAGSGAKAQGPAFKVVLLVEADRLSRQAQAGLRRTMEKAAGNCRLILCCNNPTKVIDPIRSRCLGIRVAAPTETEVCAVLQHVAAKERLTLPDELAARIAKATGRNLRRAILALEECKVAQYPFDAKATVPRPDWEQYIVAIANDVAREQSPARLLATREKLYELLAKCIPADVIIKTLARELLKNLDDGLKAEVLGWAAFYEHRMCLGNKEIFHLEAFVAKFMVI